MHESDQDATGPVMPRLAASGSPRSSRGRGWWIWTPLVLAVVAIALTALVLTFQGPASLQAQTSNPPAAGSGTSNEFLPDSTGRPSSPAATGVSPSQPAPGALPDHRQAGPFSSNSDLAPQLRHGLSLIAEGKLVEGRTVLSDLYTTAYHDLTPQDAQAIRDTLTSVNQELVFGNKVLPNDPLVETHVVQPGEVLTRITLKYKVPYPLIEQINNTPANRIRAGQRLKMIRGPLHARVHKQEFRMDVFGADTLGKPIYIRSFPVGLGEEDSTPVGTWVLSGKLQNPSWTHPRTHQHFTADDPANPIGDFWIGLQGISPGTQGKRGYGIHGTIEPDSIGRMMSMGCIRMRHEDIALLYKLLYDKLSTVVIEP